MSLAIRFPLIPKKHRETLDIILQDTFEDLYDYIYQIEQKLVLTNEKCALFGDADFKIEIVQPTHNRYYTYIINHSLLLIDYSADWWAYLSCGRDDCNRSHLRIYSATGKPPQVFDWENLAYEALIGKAKISIEAINANTGHGWHDHIPIIDFSWPLKNTLLNAMYELDLVDKEQLA